MRYSLSVSLLMLCFSAPAFAADASRQSDSIIRIDRAALQVSIDPATGQLRQPTSEEAREIAASFMKSVVRKPLTIHSQSNGTQSVELDDTYQNYFTVRVNNDGELMFNCLSNPDQVVSMLTGQTESITTRHPARRPARVMPIVWEEK